MWDRQCRPLSLERFVGVYYAVDVYLECIVSFVGIFCSSGWSSKVMEWKLVAKK